MPILVRELARAAIDCELLEESALASIIGWKQLGVTAFVGHACQRGRFPPAALYHAVAEGRGLPFVDAELAPTPTEQARKIPDVLLRRGLVLPVVHRGQVRIACADPDDRQSIATTRRVLGGQAELALAEPESLRRGTDRLRQALGRLETTGDTRASGDATRLLDRIMQEAWLRRASDVHLEPLEDGLRVRLRIDGTLRPILRALPAEDAAGLLTRAKVLAGLDIAEQRAPQDGGFTYDLQMEGGTSIDVRTASIPTRLGERVTLRLLGAATGDYTLEDLGFDAEQLEKFRAAIHRPHGLILLCGPTGSGKSTTLYAALQEINRPEANIVSVEDPIEYTIDGVSQVQVTSSDKVTFAAALRSLLRHDPDVVVIGEIRDAVTADIALKAAMTGHLVLSTLHTNSAPGAITRLVDLGCEPYRIAASLVTVIGQRLARRVCSRCSTLRPATPNEMARLHLDGPAPHVAAPRGCARCLGRGLRGRVGLFEHLYVDSHLARLIAQGATEQELRASAGSNWRTLRDDGLEKLITGVTTVDELARTTILGGA